MTSFWGVLRYHLYGLLARLQHLFAEAPEFVENDPELLRRVTDADYKARPERVLLFHVKAWDINCTQHIQQRFTEEEIAPAIQKLEGRITELEAQNASLRKQLSEFRPEPVTA